MARVRAEKKYHTFVKGLVTEANPLTYPENASLDEDNFVLKRDGSRERRLGVDFEAGHTLTDTGYAIPQIKGGRQSFHKWESPGGDSSVAIGVVRVGDKLWFMDLLTETPSSNLLNSGNPVVIHQLGNADISTAVVNNYLVIVSADLKNPIGLYYNKHTQAVSYEEIPIQVRDMWGVVDGLSADERPTELTKLHEYNLRNQGWGTAVPTVCIYANWDLAKSMTYSGGAASRLIQMVTVATATSVVSAAIQCTKEKLGKYPSNSDIWSLGKSADASSDDFEKYDPTIMYRNSLDNMEAPKGSYILNAFERGVSRRTLLGDDSLPLDKENGCLTTVASFAGRVFYSGVESDVTGYDGKSPNFSNTLFFSQVVTESSKLGKCYQEADPTSERISEIIDTDGGVIQIPEATKIVKIIATRGSLLVFAENGVWEVFGDTQGFVATSYQVSKVGSNGCSSPRSVVEASGTVLAWTKAGIYAYVIEPTSGRYVAQSLSLQSVQTLYTRMNDLSKKFAVGFYDEKENAVRWLYNDNEDYSSEEYVNRYNRELVLDLTLQAFYKQSVDTSLGPYIADYVDIPSYSVATTEEAVYAGSEPVFVDTDGVVTDNDVTIARSSQFSFLAISGTHFSLAKYTNRNFKDWQGYDGNGVDYESYLLTGHEVFQSAGSKKQVPYLWVHFKATESGFSQVNGSLEIDNPSGCLIQAQWDWTNSPNAGKWGNEFQAYKLHRHYIPTGPADTFDYGYEVIVTKNKLRGSGKSLSLLIKSESGKDMKLLGWALLVEVGR